MNIYSVMFGACVEISMEIWTVKSVLSCCPSLSLSYSQDKGLSPLRAGTCFFPESFVEEGMEGVEVGFSCGYPARRGPRGDRMWSSQALQPPSPTNQAVSYFQRSVGWFTGGNSDKHIVLKCKLRREEAPGMGDTSVCLFTEPVVWGT